jgi:hypothetical protein
MFDSLFLWCGSWQVVACAEKGKKKATIDYDELFRSEPKKSEDEWFSGMSALMLEDDSSAPGKTLPG